MYIADKDYGSRYDTAQFNAALHASYAEQERLFATYIQPLLDAAGITEKTG